jgi:hypothetical protein
LLGQTSAASPAVECSLNRPGFEKKLRPFIANIGARRVRCRDAQKHKGGIRVIGIKRKPRTECCCHPVAFMIAAMVVPCDPLSRAMTLARFESTRGDLPGVAALRDFADWVAVSSWNPPSVSDGNCRHHRSPTVAITPAGRGFRSGPKP